MNARDKKSISHMASDSNMMKASSSRYDTPRMSLDKAKIESMMLRLSIGGSNELLALNQICHKSIN
jgi:hypothetical protein